MFFIPTPFNNMCTLKFKAQQTKMCFVTVSPTVRQLLSSSDYCRVCGNHIAEYRSDNETVLSSSWKLGGAAKHFIDGSKNHICRLSFEFQSLHVIEEHSKELEPVLITQSEIVCAKLFTQNNVLLIFNVHS